MSVVIALNQTLNTKVILVYTNIAARIEHWTPINEFKNKISKKTVANTQDKPLHFLLKWRKYWKLASDKNIQGVNTQVKMSSRRIHTQFSSSAWGDWRDKERINLMRGTTRTLFQPPKHDYIFIFNCAPMMARVLLVSTFWECIHM